MMEVADRVSPAVAPGRAPGGRDPQEIGTHQEVPVIEITSRLVRPAAVACGLLASGCLFAAAGAGAGSAIYYRGRGVESIVPAPIARTYTAAQQTLTQLGIQPTKTTSQQEGGSDQREISGATSDGDVTVTLESRGDDTRVQVVARKSAVTWDKDLARRILKRIVDLAA
jgi:Protein of unknown function (DUF3568)